MMMMMMMMMMMSATAEIRRGKKERKTKETGENITFASATQGGHNKIENGENLEQFIDRLRW